MTVENISWSDLHEMMLPTRQGSNLQPSDQELNGRPTEPLRPALGLLVWDKSFFNFFLFLFLRAIIWTILGKAH